uniref:C2 domain-containing protein n=1 Tax=Ananas comosus var. bracteatus TaxID=296719 RepID=A0A6V7PFB1_ANACO|nr:unnamed protein product [Ananas comosus var. bracteatus]
MTRNSVRRARREDDGSERRAFGAVAILPAVRVEFRPKSVTVVGLGLSGRTSCPLRQRRIVGPLFTSAPRIRPSDPLRFKYALFAPNPLALSDLLLPRRSSRLPSVLRRCPNPRRAPEFRLNQNLEKSRITGITKHLEKNQNPSWHQVFAFSKDRIQANFVGRIVFDLTEAPLAPQWYKLEDKKGDKLSSGGGGGTQPDEAFPTPGTPSSSTPLPSVHPAELAPSPTCCCHLFHPYLVKLLPLLLLLYSSAYSLTEAFLSNQMAPPSKA